MTVARLRNVRRETASSEGSMTEMTFSFVRRTLSVLRAVVA